MLSNYVTGFFSIDIALLGEQIMVFMVIYAGLYAIFKIQKLEKLREAGRLSLGQYLQKEALVVGSAWMVAAIAISIGGSGSFARDPHWTIPVLWFIALLICVSRMLKAEEHSGYWDESKHIGRNPATHQGSGI